MKKELYLILFLFITGIVSAQNREQKQIDSLRIELSKAKEDTVKVKILNQLSEQSCWFGNYDTALQYANSALVVAKKTDFKRGMVIAYNNIGAVDFFQGNYPEAMDNSLTALQIAGTIGDKNEMAGAYNNIGRVYSRQNNNSKAIENYLKSIEIMESIGNKSGMAKAYNNIGLVYVKQNKYEKAIENYTTAFDLMKSIGDTRSQYIIYNNIGEMHSRMGDYSQALEKYLASLKVFESIGDNKGMSISYLNVGLTYLKLGRAAEGKKWLQESLAFSRKLDTKEYIKSSYEGLAKADSISGDFPSSLENYKMFIVYRDSLVNEENTKKLTQTQMQYEFDKKEAIAKSEQEKKEALSREQLAKARNNRNLALAGVGIFMIVTVFSGIGFFQKKKSNKIISNEKQKSDNLLLNILPEEVAEELKERGATTAKQFDAVSVLFTDFANFTQTAEKLTPQQLVQELNECFTAFDNIIERNGLEKIKTIGDAYMAVCGLPVSDPKHAHRTIKAALEIRNFIEERRKRERVFDIRIGINSGSVVAGIVGIKKFAYDIWGDAVNTAARMESNGAVGKINISESTYNLVKDDFSFEYRGEIEAKGKGKVGMYFVSEKRIDYGKE